MTKWGCRESSLSRQEAWVILHLLWFLGTNCDFMNSWNIQSTTHPEVTHRQSEVELKPSLMCSALCLSRCTESTAAISRRKKQKSALFIRRGQSWVTKQRSNKEIRGGREQTPRSPVHLSGNLFASGSVFTVCISQAEGDFLLLLQEEGQQSRTLESKRTWMRPKHTPAQINKHGMARQDDEDVRGEVAFLYNNISLWSQPWVAACTKVLRTKRELITSNMKTSGSL